MEGTNKIYKLVFVTTPVSQNIACFCDDTLAINKGDQCIFEYNHVPDFGLVSTIEYKENIQPENIKGKILRRATLQDHAHNQENELMARMAKETCVQKVKNAGLNLRVVRIHYSFDRSVLTILFCTSERQDFRQVVKELSQELKTRIEMKQIGVRDEVRLIGGIGPCGRCLCCVSWIKKFDSINVKMAKVQKLSLNPEVIGGNCGRLKCCLAYEVETYKEFAKTMLSEGDIVESVNGVGTIIESSFITGKIKVKLKQDARECFFHVSEVKLIQAKGKVDRSSEIEKSDLDDTEFEVNNSNV